MRGAFKVSKKIQKQRDEWYRDHVAHLREVFVARTRDARIKLREVLK